MRNQLYYIRSHFMCVLPTFQPLNEDGVVKLVLVRTLRVLKKRSSAGKKTDQACAAVMEAILAKGTVASREYFGRGWTLAERMGRHLREEKLCHWISLEAWLGMLVDAMIKSERASGGKSEGACRY